MRMKEMRTAEIKENLPYAAALIILAVFIWLRDLVWVSTAEDTLPILVSIPLFVWLGTPWKFRDSPVQLSSKEIAAPILLFVLGIAIDNTLLLALSWSLFLWIWLKSRVLPETLPKIKKLMIFPLISFPWISLHAQTIGWWFRYSGASTAGWFFSFLGYEVAQEGTNLLVSGIPISVEVACAGLNTLQSMLIAGSTAAYLFLGNSDRYYWNLPLLVVIAWFANTLRIISVSASALLFGTAFALDFFHDFGGWLVIMVMFALSWGLFALQETPNQPGRGAL